MSRFLFLFLLACSVHAETLTGYVTEITDGDTIVVLDADHRQHRIRLAGIDAPERHQAFGSRSTESIARLTFNKNVTVVWKKEDRGRPIGKVMVNGVDVSLEQVKAGMAWWYRKYAKEQSPTDRRLYEQAEQQAQAQRIRPVGRQRSHPAMGIPACQSRSGYGSAMSMFGYRALYRPEGWALLPD